MGTSPLYFGNGSFGGMGAMDNEGIIDRSRNRRCDSGSQIDNKQQYQLDLEKIVKGEDSRTTLMIKNIPNKYTSRLLLTAIDETNKGTCDFLYLPAFITLGRPEALKAIAYTIQSSNNKVYLHSDELLLNLQERKADHIGEKLVEDFPNLGLLIWSTIPWTILANTGERLVGFARKVGDVLITTAKLIAARDGLALAWERRLPRVCLEVDSEVVINLIKKAKVQSHPLGNIIKDCRRLLRMPWESEIIHTLRSGNSHADALAATGHYINIDNLVWLETLEDLVVFIAEDMM